MDKSVGVDQLCELMLLADRYSVDNLKDICENTLMASIDGDSVIYLLGIADRFNAATLKASCLSYLSQHTELTRLEIFGELPGYLQVWAMKKCYDVQNLNNFMSLWLCHDFQKLNSPKTNTIVCKTLSIR